MSDDLTELFVAVCRARRALDRQTGEARAVATTGKTLTAEIAHLREQVDLHERAAGVLATFGEERQAAAQAKIETLVTEGLRTIFGKELSFHLVPTVRAKTPVVDFVVRSTLDDGRIIETDVMDARGGGLAATVGFLLRVVILLLSPQSELGVQRLTIRATGESILFLDETFAFLSEDRHDAMAQFLRELTDKTGVQVIMVTHTPALAAYADKVYRFELVAGATKATELGSTS